MSSQRKYYKEKLGFDPKEANYHDGLAEKPQGYEENLTKFKGTIWDMFIESLEGTVVGCHVSFLGMDSWCDRLIFLLANPLVCIWLSLTFFLILVLQ